MPMIIAIGFWAGVSSAQESATGDEAPQATATEEKIEAKKEFKPPPGFRTKKRGGIVVYCVKDSTVGSRFKDEKCFEEGQLKDYLLARDENKRDMDQRRSICTACSAN